MEFKAERVRLEYAELKRRNPALVAVLAVADRESRHISGKGILVTMIQRTSAEQEALLALRRKQGDAAAGAGTRSVHEVWRGADLRSWIYTSDQIAELVARLNRQFIYGKGKLQVAGFHARGSGAHIHLQTPAGAVWTPPPWAE